MAITARLVSAQAFFVDGTVSLKYGVDLQDDTLGTLGNRGYSVDDPAITASVLAYVAQMLPSIEAQVGVPVEPLTPPTVPPVEPEA